METHDLRKVGLKVTHPRMRILALLEQRNAQHHMTAEDIYRQLLEHGDEIGLATVYRALSDLAVEGEADSLQSPEGESLYRACTPGTHHHHLICRRCGLTVEIAADAVETWAHSVAAQNGFTDAHHVVDVFGLCAECTRAVAAAE